jgi:hypothetical protein
MPGESGKGNKERLFVIDAGLRAEADAISVGRGGGGPKPEDLLITFLLLHPR